MGDRDPLTLQDWRRRVFELYADLRAAPDPALGWQRWRTDRDVPSRTTQPRRCPRTHATSGATSYGAGRYLLDTVKGADLGTHDGRLVVDFSAPACPTEGAGAWPTLAMLSVTPRVLEAEPRADPAVAAARPGAPPAPPGL